MKNYPGHSQVLLILWFSLYLYIICNTHYYLEFLHFGDVKGNDRLSKKNYTLLWLAYLGKFSTWLDQNHYCNCLLKRELYLLHKRDTTPTCIILLPFYCLMVSKFPRPLKFIQRVLWGDSTDRTPKTKFILPV